MIIWKLKWQVNDLNWDIIRFLYFLNQVAQYHFFIGSHLLSIKFHMLHVKWDIVV